MATITPGGGADDTAALQAAINNNVGGTLELQPGATGIFHVNPITIPSNSNIIVHSGVTVYANAGYTTLQRMINIGAPGGPGVSNVTISGVGGAANCVFRMRKADYTDEQRHCFYVTGGIGSLSSNVNISGVSGNDSGGDGLYVDHASNVTATDCIFNNNRRQGCSLTDMVQHIRLERSQFTGSSGTDPQAGIDIEPNPPSGSGPPANQNYSNDIKIIDCVTSNNVGNGIYVQPWVLTSASPQPVTIYILRNQSVGNGRNGYQVQNGDPTNPPGYIIFEDCTSNNSGYFGAWAKDFAGTGAPAIFKNLSISNPQVNGPEPQSHNSAGIVVSGGGGRTAGVGNVHFLNVTISSTNGKMDRYYSMWDSSTPNVTNVQFIPAHNGLSGATNVANLGEIQISSSMTPFGVIH